VQNFLQTYTLSKVGAASREYIRIALSRKTPEAVFHFHEGMIYSAAGARAAAQLALCKSLSFSPNFDPLQTPLAMKTLAERGVKP
jgi:hypothetical protein